MTTRSKIVAVLRDWPEVKNIGPIADEIMQAIDNRPKDTHNPRVYYDSIEEFHDTEGLRRALYQQGRHT